MKANHLSITTLEEYEPNPEFVGRNFNAGEIIQLVLRARDGSWLSFRSVQMVMMHELAHCMQMNHSGAFWKTRNQYAGELRGLWAKGYTGDGFWGRGKTLLSERYENTIPIAPEVMPRSLCGGTFRSRGRKRKRRGAAAGEGLTYAEKKQKRIEKKFGANGMALGGDDETRVKLEDGQKVKAKPRVAGSNRGRELRAAAALARFGQQKEEDISKAEDGFDSGSEMDDDGDVDESKEAVNVDGSRMLDSKGHSMFRICEDEDQDDVHVKQEMQELEDLESRDPAPTTSSQNSLRSNPDLPSPTSAEQTTAQASKPFTPLTTFTGPFSVESEPETMSVPIVEAKQNAPDSTERATNCSICSMINESSAAICSVCCHVLNVAKVPGHWRCQSATCAQSQYINVADSALCGVCGTRQSG